MMPIWAILLGSVGLLAQRPEFDFYPDAEELRREGVAEREIARRLDLPRNHRTEFEADRWNRF
jgi:hypothetical protein